LIHINKFFVEMCVDSKSMSCCGSCTLTTATIVLGVFYFLAAMSSAGQSQWWSMVINLIIVILIVIAVVQKHNAEVRRKLFIVVTACQIVNIIVLIASYCYFMFSDWVEETCVVEMLSFSGNYASFDDCVVTVKLFITAAFTITLILQLILGFIEV